MEKIVDLKVGRPKTEDRSRKTEVGRPKSEVGRRKLEEQEYFDLF